MPAGLRPALHRCGLARAEDCFAACLTQDCRTAWSDAAAVPRLHDDRPFLEHLDYWPAQQRLEFLPRNL